MNGGMSEDGMRVDLRSCAGWGAGVNICASMSMLMVPLRECDALSRRVGVQYLIARGDDEIRPCVRPSTGAFTDGDGTNALPGDVLDLLHL